VYTPAHFDASDPAFCHAVIRAYPFAPLVMTGAASHLPFLLDAARGPLGTLVGHVARASPHADAALAGAPALVLFTGPHAYVSPSWYQTAPAVPTWNYCAVHVHAVPRPLDDAATRDYLDRLAATFDTSGWRLSTQPADYQAKMLRGIVAFDLPIDRLEGKAKLSQNRSDADRAGVVAALERSLVTTDHEVAAWMRRSR
jgi:transcriptional regulator